KLLKAANNMYHDSIIKTPKALSTCHHSNCLLMENFKGGKPLNFLLDHIRDVSLSDIVAKLSTEITGLFMKIPFNIVTGVLKTSPKIQKQMMISDQTAASIRRIGLGVKMGWIILDFFIHILDVLTTSKKGGKVTVIHCDYTTGNIMTRLIHDDESGEVSYQLCLIDFGDSFLLHLKTSNVEGLLLEGYINSMNDIFYNPSKLPDVSNLINDNIEKVLRKGNVTSKILQEDKYATIMERMKLSIGKISQLLAECLQVLYGLMKQVYPLLKVYLANNHHDSLIDELNEIFGTGEFTDFRRLFKPLLRLKDHLRRDLEQWPQTPEINILRNFFLTTRYLTADISTIMDEHIVDMEAAFLKP
ncbi:hypothetical protein EBS02_11460, partial [bacterium]|nr:hypothetical protein [bacterium]